MEKTQLLYEGKAKKVWSTDLADIVIVEYKDDATAFNGLKKGTIVGKGIVNNKVSNFLFKKLESFGIPTHFVEELSDRETAVKKLRLSPSRVCERTSRRAASKRLGFEEGTKLERTVLEYCYKTIRLGDPRINEYHIYALGLATEEDKGHRRLFP